MNEKALYRIALFIVLCIFLRMSVFAGTALSAVAYYAMLVLFFIVSLFLYNKGNHLSNGFLLCFLFVGLFSILFNDVMPEFHPWMRLGGFALISLTFGPLLFNSYIYRLKIMILELFIKVGVGFCIISLFMKLAGIALISPTAFGLSYHDMTIAPIAYICSIFTLNEYVQSKSCKIKKLLIFLLCVVCGFLTGSRGAMGSFLFAVALYFILGFRGRKKYYYIGLFGLFFFMVYTINPGGILDRFFEKMNRDSDDISYVLSGRDKMIEDRIADFKSSPVYGVGFASMKNIWNSKVRFEEGVIESGSSWFLILGSTGLLGLLFFISAIIKAIRKPLLKRENIPLIACILFILSHIMIEGYIISFGAPLCAMFWLFISIAEGDEKICNIKESII